MKKRKISPPARKKTQEEEFTCSVCGYEAYKQAKLAHCPLCIICKGCQEEVRRCRCLEGE